MMEEMFGIKKDCRRCEKSFDPLNTKCWYFCSKECCDSSYYMSVDDINNPNCIGCMGQVIS